MSSGDEKLENVFCLVFLYLYFIFIVALSGILQQLPKHPGFPCTCDLLLSNLHLIAAYLHLLWKKQNTESWPRGSIHDFESPTCPKSTAVHVHQTLPTYIRPLL